MLKVSDFPDKQERNPRERDRDNRGFIDSDVLLCKESLRVVEQSTISLLFVRVVCVLSVDGRGVFCKTGMD